MTNKNKKVGGRQLAVGKWTTFNNYYAIILIAIIASGCSSKPPAENAKAEVTENTITLTDVQYKNGGIEVGKMEQKQVSSILKVNGKIDVPPQNMVSISVPLGGYLKSTNLLPGMAVRKGQSLAIIEDPQYIQMQQDLLIAKVQFAALESEYTRQLELNKSKAVSDKSFEEIKSKYFTEKITIQSLKEKLNLIGINPETLNENNISRRISLYSPINGFTTRVNANIGKYVNPSDVLFELVDPSDIHLNLNIFEKDIHKLYIGQKLVAYTNIHPDIKHKCEIILISKDINQNGSTEVHCHFNDYDKELFPGMYMNAEIEIKNNVTTVLPENAVVRFEGKQYIFEAGDNRQFTMHEVEVGSVENGYIEIVNGQSLAAKNIVTKGAYTLLMSLKNKEE